MNRIVVGIDGSEQGWSALAKAAELARATGAGLQVAHISMPMPPMVAAEGFVPTSTGWASAQETLADGLLREAVSRSKCAGLEVTSVTRVGQPAEMLAELVQPEEVTMVVVGHRGRNLVARLLVGSVADRLVQLSSKPVLVVH
jgi:nucleotide-binding universal stress UspA family protein